MFPYDEKTSKEYRYVVLPGELMELRDDLNSAHLINYENTEE